MSLYWQEFYRTVIAPLWMPIKTGAFVGVGLTSNTTLAMKPSVLYHPPPSEPLSPNGPFPT
jgi:hypothetical protein